VPAGRATTDRDTKVAQPPHREGCERQGRTIKAKTPVCLSPPFVQRKGPRGERGRETGVRFDNRESLVAHLNSVAEARRQEAGIGLLNTNGSSKSG
jgi:hypothetical protein